MSGTASEQVTLDVTDWLKPVGLRKSYYILVYFLPLAGIVQNGIGQTVDMWAFVCHFPGTIFNFSHVDIDC